MAGNVLRVALALGAAAAVTASPALAHGPLPPQRSFLGEKRAAALVPWCGDEAASSDRPDAVTSYQFHVIYTHASDQADRFRDVASGIVTDIAAVESWWRHQDGREVRFDLASFPNCASEIGRLDISDVALPQSAAFYAANDARSFDADVAAQGFASSAKKYLVFYEGKIVASVPNCGFGSTGLPLAGGEYAYSEVEFDSPRCGFLGMGEWPAHGAAHEILHNLNALPWPWPTPGPPHPCPDHAHPCDDVRDVLTSLVSPTNYLEDAILDVGRDDYYGHSGSWWDTQDSPWLVDLNLPRYSLTLAIEGSGSGRVESDLPGVSCSTSCTTSWFAGATVTLTATPAEGTAFIGWSGACTDAAPTCRLTIGAPTSVTARFGKLVPLNVAVTAADDESYVWSEPVGISCPPECSALFAQTSSVTLTAEPADGFRFAGWTGCPASESLTCSLAVDGTQTVAARFTPATYRLAVKLVGRGRVVSRPAGIDCPRRCAAEVPVDRVVALKPQPSKGWAFAGWAGGCRGSGTCAIRVSADLTVSARFRRG